MTLAWVREVGNGRAERGNNVQFDLACSSRGAAVAWPRGQARFIDLEGAPKLAYVIRHLRFRLSWCTLKQLFVRVRGRSTVVQ